MSPGLRGIGLGVTHHWLNAIFPELPDDIHYLSVPAVRAIFLKCKTQNPHTGLRNSHVLFDELFHSIFSHITAHTIINPAPGEDHLRFVA